MRSNYPIRNSKPTDRQRAYLTEVINFLSRHNRSPTHRDMLAIMGYKQLNSSKQCVFALAQKGHMEFSDGRAGLQLSDRYRVVVVDTQEETHGDNV